VKQLVVFAECEKTNLLREENNKLFVAGGRDKGSRKNADPISLYRNQFDEVKYGSGYLEIIKRNWLYE
jgi:hypothetical protein